MIHIPPQYRTQQSPNTRHRELSQNQADEKSAGLTVHFQATEFHNDRFYQPTEEYGEPEQIQRPGPADDITRWMEWPPDIKSPHN